MTIQTLEIEGTRYVLVKESDFNRLRGKRTKGAAAGARLPAWPAKTPDGNYPALDAIRVSLARRIIKARSAAGMTQAEMARAAGIRVESLNRIERARVMPDARTVGKIERALSKHGQVV